MKKGLYIVNFGYKITDEHKKNDGVLKKILGQIKAFSDADIKVELFNVSEKHLDNVSKFFYSFFYRKQYLSGNYECFKDIDFVYIRHFLPINIGCICLLKYLHNIGCKIIYEFPTYPYEGEHRGFKGFIFLIIDRLFRTFLKKYIDYAATYSNDDMIFGIHTIKIVNGIDCSKIPIVKYTKEKKSDTLRLIAVANFNEWHGYDRLIDGLYEYYKKTINKEVYLELIGNGSSIKKYVYQVQQYHLEKYVTFHGALSDEFLTNVFNQSDIAVCSLGCHRIGIYKGSFLKSREYMARGLPMISSTKIDLLNDSFPYIFYVPEDESSIDITSIISFYDQLKNYGDREFYIHAIRDFAEQNYDIKVTMQPVIDKVIDN
ncbi:glycosyltransferase [Treponema sp. OMZ 787]|uniref:glycosyltransferase n=1 Tax=Treponema sp. OMZ 787 TaxID=2563669 RepID=UPI0020A58BF6|nr:glycosyltransferase [Treponema sp. OMZ 787]UTC61604.1 glycosyltransferase [Treponema sp. OMZ 787]